MFFGKLCVRTTWMTPRWSLELFHRSIEGYLAPHIVTSPLIWNENQLVEIKETFALYEIKLTKKIIINYRRIWLRVVNLLSANPSKYSNTLLSANPSKCSNTLKEFVFNVNFEHISHLVLVFLLLTLSK